MCGIAGILNAGDPHLDAQPRLRVMADALRHRGPDDRGQWSSPSGVAAFAHTRLSILDLSAAGRQPMSTPDGRYTAVLNGEIYNFLDLRRGLEQKGFTFRTGTDTEVVLHAFQEHGRACLGLLRGMFALAIWDEREQTCLMARDRFGIKPLYYYDDEQGSPLVFGSELKVLLASGLVPRALDRQAVYQYFRTGSVPEPRTLLRHVRMLPAGHFARWHGGRLETGQYWAVQFPPATIPAGEAVAATRAALLDSVTHHFIGDVPVGIFLSGGIDSSALVALACAAGHRNLQTVSLSLPGSPDDEGPSARQIAKHFGTRHDDLAVDDVAGKAMLRQFLGAVDQPSVDGLNTFALAGFARQRGLKVALSGLGADELFGGYRSFRDVPRLAKWNRLLSRTGAARQALGAALEDIAPGPRWRRVGDMLRQPAGLTTAYTTFRGIFTRAESRRLADRYAGGPDDAGDDEAREGPSSAGFAEGDGVSTLELTRYVRNQLLREGDVMSMAWGLEMRTPFIDAGVFETVSAIPAAVRLRAGKQLLLDAVPELPGWVGRQPKRCFQFPFEQWLEGGWREVFADVSRTCPVPTETWYRKWCVFMIEHWLERLHAIPGDQPIAAGAVGGGRHR